MGAASFDLPTDSEDDSETQTHKAPARALMEGEKERKDIKSKAADKLLCMCV